MCAVHLEPPRLGLILQLGGHPEDHAVSRPPCLDGHMSSDRVCHLVKYLGVGHLVDRSTVKVDAVPLCHQLHGLSQGVPDHLLHDLLLNPHRVMACDVHDRADSATSSPSTGKLARVEWGQLAKQMLHLRLVIEVFNPRSPLLVLGDVTRPYAMPEGSFCRSCRLYEKKYSFRTRELSTNTE